MVLGDNISRHGLSEQRPKGRNAETLKGATVFGYYVDDPERFDRRIDSRKSHLHQRN